MFMSWARAMLRTVKSMDEVEELRCKLVVLVVDMNIEVP